MQFAVSGQALAETHSLEQICVAAQQRGIRAIELWPLNAPAASPARQQVTRYEGRDFEHVRRVLGDHGMRLACITLDGAFNAEMMADLADYGAALKYTVEMAGELGSPLVNHYCYQLALEAAPDFAKLRDVWGPAIEAADATGVTLVLENEAHDATRTPEGMLAILEAIDHPRFATNYDACNYFHAGVEGFPHSYERLKSRIAYVHLKNGCIFNPSAGHSEDHKGAPFSGGLAGYEIYYPTLAHGAVNIDGLVARLIADGYAGCATFEPHTSPQHVLRYWDEDLDYLRRRGYFTEEKP